MMKRIKKINFIAHKKVSRPVTVRFDTKRGPVSFKATKKVTKPVRVKFYAKKNK